MKRPLIRSQRLAHGTQDGPESLCPVPSGSQRNPQITPFSIPISMPNLQIHEVTRENWRAALHLAVHPEQQRFIADYAPIAALGLAKAYVRPGGLFWTPYAIYSDGVMVEFCMLAHAADNTEAVWIYHFFIDYRHQGKGQGRSALCELIVLIMAQYPNCKQIRLSVHPENQRAQRLYTDLGFQSTGEQQDGEPVYCLTRPVSAPAQRV